MAYKEAARVSGPIFSRMATKVENKVVFEFLVKNKVTNFCSYLIIKAFSQLTSPFVCHE